MAGERNDNRDAAGTEAGVRDSLKRELEGEIRQVLEAELREELSQELRERLGARLKAELAEEIQVRIARVKAELEAEFLARAVPVPAPVPVAVPRQFERFSMNFRVQHMVLLASCLILIVTGLPLKFHEARISQIFFDLVGGVRVSTLIHRIGAVGLMAVGAYHLLYLLAFREGRRNFLALLPVPKDVTDFFQMLRYFLGRREEKPRFGRFSYVEKSEYWALVWGTIIMALTGAVMWFDNISIGTLTKLGYDISREIHYYEAWLATLAVVVWHFYFVIFNPDVYPVNLAFWSGTLTEEEMSDEHALKLEEIKRNELKDEFRETAEVRPTDGDNSAPVPKSTKTIK